MKNTETKIKRPLVVVAVLTLCVLLVSAVSCNKSTEEPSLTPYSLVIPDGFPKMKIPTDNEPYVERIALGRKLYYDAILSNNGMSCSSCHLQNLGFTINSSSGMPVLPHINMGWKDKFMWDGREQGTLEDVMLFEVEQFFGTDIAKLNAHSQYPTLFSQAYGIDNIKSKDVAKALAQFFRVLISSDSKFDKVQRNEAQFTNDELQGFMIFNSEKGSCTHCHVPPFFADNGLHNIGLDSDFSDPANQGYFHESGDSAHLGQMRTPTLRNVSLRARYMHDGRFSSLEDVINQYNTGVQRTPYLDPIMIKSNNTVNLNLTPLEVSQLAAFLRTLTDSTFIKNPNFSKP